MLTIEKGAEQPPSHEELLVANNKFMHFLEGWTEGLGLTVLGVDLVACTNYELVQVLNHTYLVDRLGGVG